MQVNLKVSKKQRNLTLRLRKKYTLTKKIQREDKYKEHKKACIVDSDT